MEKTIRETEFCAEKLNFLQLEIKSLSYYVPKFQIILLINERVVNLSAKNRPNLTHVHISV